MDFFNGTQTSTNNVHSFDVSLQEEFVQPSLEEVPVVSMATANVSVNRMSVYKTEEEKYAERQHTTAVGRCGG
jgi:hypothetical protein